MGQPGLALTGQGPNDSGQKSPNFSGHEYCNPNPINFPIKRAVNISIYLQFKLAPFFDWLETIVDQISTIFLLIL